MRTLALVLTLTTFGAALSGCNSEPKALSVIDPTVRLAATPNAPAVAYFKVKGGATADRLLMVTSPLVIRAELHESMSKDGMGGMKPLEAGVEIPAGAEIDFKEGGKHVMLFNLNPGLKPGETVQMNFTFASGLQLRAFAPVRAAGSLR